MRLREGAAVKVVVVAGFGLLAILAPTAYWQEVVVSALEPPVPDLTGERFNIYALGALVTGTAGGLFSLRLPGFLLYVAAALVGTLLAGFVWFPDSSPQELLVGALVVTLWFPVFFGGVGYVGGHAAQARWGRWRSALSED